MTSLLAVAPTTSTDTSNTLLGAAPVESAGTPDQGTGVTPDGINWEKRYRDLQSHYDREKHRLLEEVKQAQASTKLPSTPEEIEAFKETEPGVYNMMLTVFRQEFGESAQLGDRVAAVENDVNQSKAEKARTAILAKYPDFSKIVNSDTFKAWIVPQKGGDVYNWVYRNPDNAELAIAALDLFKAQASNTNEPTPDAASAADAISSNSAPLTDDQGHKIWTRSDIMKLRPEEYELVEDEIDKAYAENRVDMSR